MHVDDIVLLRIAFPKADEPVDEALVRHVMCCRECWEHVRLMREITNTLPQLRVGQLPKIGSRLPTDSVAANHDKAEYTTPGSNGDVLPSAAMNDTPPSTESYLDSDSENSWRIYSDDEEGEMLPNLPEFAHGEFDEIE